MSMLLMAGVAAVVATLVTRWVLSYARRRLLDLPNERSSHHAPTPRGGGLGLVVGVLAAGATALLLPDPAAGLVPLVLIAAMAALGWWDDHASLSARLRLGVQFAIVGAMVAWIGLSDTAVLGPWRFTVPLPLLGAVAVIGGVWLVNLTNFMDGIDGIAGIQGLVGCAGLAVVLTPFDADPAIRLAMPVLVAGAGACAGFLVWNWPPARIFMGDVGSTALGLVFALGVIAGLHAGIPVEALVLPLMPFIADATCTLLRRAWRRERLSQAHRSHLYQRLARRWSSHRPVTLLYGALALMGVGLAVAGQRAMLPPLGGLGLWLITWVLLVMYGRRSCPATMAG